MLSVCLAAIDTPEDRDKLQSIYDAYCDGMYHTAYAILGSRQDAEDAVQQAFVSIALHVHKLESAPSPGTQSYVLVTAERKAIDILRSRRPELPLDEERISGISVPLPGDGGLADAMAVLPARYREVLLLHYANGFSTRDISHLTGIKMRSVQKLLWRAKNALREALEKEGITV